MAISYYVDDFTGRKGIGYSVAGSVASANAGAFSGGTLDLQPYTDVGRFVSMATNRAGTARFLAWRDLTNRTARWARCTVASGLCSFTSPALLPDAASSDHGKNTVVSYDAQGFPRIAYLDVANGKIRVVVHDNASAFNETAEFAASASPTGLSMAFGTGVNVAYDSTTPALKFFTGP